MQAPDSSIESTNSEPLASLVQRTEEYAREEPLKAVGTAFGAGLILTLLPIGAIVGLLVRLALSLMRPALLVLGTMKLYEEIDRRRNQ